MTSPDARQVRIPTNGVRLNARIAGTGPLVLMVHGFPGSSFSWRHQMAPLADAGFTAVAVDARGYGASDRPAAVDGAYDMETHLADLLGVLEHLGADDAALVGQDFGSRYAWNLARHHPDRVRAVAGTVPFSDLAPDQRPTELWQALAGQHFLHLDYFQEVGRAERDLGGANAQEFLTRLLWSLSGEGEYFRVFGSSADASYLDALPPAPPLPWTWLDETEFATMLAGFRAGGDGAEFHGGFSAYRAADADWEWEGRARGRRISAPAMLVIGEHDPVRKFAQTDPTLFEDLGEVVVPGAGHHVQQERPEEFNAALLEFLTR